MRGRLMYATTKLEASNLPVEAPKLSQPLKKMMTALIGRQRSALQR